MIFSLRHMLPLALCLMATPALAQVQGLFGQPAGQAPQDEVPADALPPMPQEAIDHATQQDNMAPAQPQPLMQSDNAAPVRLPPLPPSAPCTQASIVGVWKLVDVYESPSGAESASLTARPFQYMMFSQDSTYGKYDDSQAEIPEGKVIDQIHASGAGLLQYVLDASGIMYFYQQGVATDSMACFIVTDRAGPFFPGQMLMMPPKGQQKARLVKVYGKNWWSQQQPQRRPGRRPVPLQLPNY